MSLIAQLDRNRKIGAEVEAAIPIIGSGDGHSVQETIAHILTANGVRACSRPYQPSPIPANCDIAVEYDSSITGEQRYQGVRWAQVECKTRILDGVDDWERIVPPTLDILRYCGARVNASTGHHLHLGFDEINDHVRHVRSLWNLFHRFDAVLFGLTAPSRRNNTYCRPMPAGTKLLHGANSMRELRRRLSGYNRYQALNLTHIFEESPHIELRHHHGTLDPQKARMWLRLALALVRHAVVRSCQAAPASLPNTRKSLDALLITTGLKINTRVYSSIDPELRDCGRWVLKSWKKFNGNVPLSKSRSGFLDGEQSAAVEEIECAA